MESTLLAANETLISLNSSNHIICITLPPDNNNLQQLMNGMEGEMRNRLQLLIFGKKSINHFLFYVLLRSVGDVELK
ncbi:CLUMA_CG002851, isoform A [Clunio marinus]|uniref:CLUMA_CG002743, isoform A n=1 Tax=Clunio marinus TaxID=568069 RepID=A0A1J1HLQ7_9DIPT|nr:CLUMA_CG002743, isoform A [Clunio marinus]CRK88866.1 CLUMA_CG002851, isoform A [Clunio marinus]